MKKESLMTKFFVPLLMIFGVLVLGCKSGSNSSITHTVTFDTVGGTYIEPQSVVHGEKIQKPDDPSRDGYTFVDWYYEDEVWSFVGYSVTEDITLTAKWNIIEYTIEYNLDGGINNSNNPTTYTVEDEINLYDARKDWFDFVGWFDESGEQVVFISKGTTGNLKLFANWGGNNQNGTITIAILSDNTEKTIIKTLIDDYIKIPGNENKRFKVTLINNYNDYIYDSFLYDELADIVQVFDYNSEYYANADLDGTGTSLLQPISNYMQRDGIKESDFYESIVEMTKCKTGSSEMYWMPREYNKVVCAYNKKIFDIAGMSYPTNNWTWADFVHICNELKANASIIKQQYSFSATFLPVDMNLDFAAVYYPILKSYGVDLIDKETRTCFGNTPEKLNTAKEAWAKLLDMADDKLAAPPGGNQIPFINKQAAMMFMVRPNLPTYVERLGEDAIDFVSLPTYEDLPLGSKSFVGITSNGYGITTACEEYKMEAAWSFIKYIASERGQNALSESGAGIPCLKKLATDPNAVFKQYMVSEENHPNHDAFIDYPERDVPMNFMKGFEVDKQLIIDRYIKNRTLRSFYMASNRDQYFIDYKNDMEQIWLQ